MKKVFPVDEGDVTVTLPGPLSAASCDRLEVWLTSFLQELRARATLPDQLRKLGQSMAEKVSNDREPAP